MKEVAAALSVSEAQLVSSVSISILSRKDKLKWSYDRQGRLTVKSAYHHIRAIEGSKFCSDNDAGIDSIHSTLWLAVWKAKTQPKIRVFAWKLLSDVVAMRASQARDAGGDRMSDV